MFINRGESKMYLFVFLLYNPLYYFDPLSTEATDQPGTSNQPRTQRHHTWRVRSPHERPTDEPIFCGTRPAASGPPRQPIAYFRDIMDDHFIEHIVEQSKLYALQCDINKPMDFDPNKLEQFIGMVFWMSIVKMPRARLYWGTDTRYDKIADVMPCNTFETIKRNIHINNNAARPENCTDKLYKIRPLVDHFRGKVNELTVSEKISVDEQVVPFKGKSILRTYNPKKPKKWGYKIFVASGVNGLIHDFEIYVGRIDKCPGQPDVGASGNIVLRLLQNVPRDVWHQVYFDNYFNSPALQVTLHKQGIASVGTVRSNRLRGCKLQSDKDLKKRGRGSSQMQTAMVEDVELIAVKWYDNKPVTLLSTYAAVDPIKTVKRWDKARHQEIEVPCPSVILLYNSFMGGVDLLDSLMALYRSPIRSKKWYHRMLFHFMDMAVVQAWLLYRLDCDHSGLPNNERLPLLQFKLQIAKCLVMEKKGNGTKRGRPSLEVEPQLALKKRKGPAAPVPPLPVRIDNFGHWPDLLKDKGRCKMPGCKGFSRTKCEKCRVYLCYTQNSNCFKKFHQP